MITAVDTNIISALWSAPVASLQAETLLLSAHRRGRLIICPVVYAELQAHPGIAADAIDDFLAAAAIEVDLTLDRTIWREAGHRFAAYSGRRARQKSGTPRRLLADFIVGAHAMHRATSLLTFNHADFRKDFPELTLFE